MESQVRSTVLGLKRQPEACTIAFEAVSMVDAMLHLNPIARITAGELLKHPWIDAHRAAAPVSATASSLVQLSAAVVRSDLAASPLSPAPCASK